MVLSPFKITKIIDVRLLEKLQEKYMN